MKSPAALLVLASAMLSSAGATGGESAALPLATNVTTHFPQAAAHWAFRPPTRPAEPVVNDASWPRTPIDAFVLSRLEHEGMTPSPEADRATLIRRLSFDLAGLPPTPAEVTEFLKDSEPGAYERLVERLLASPHYGERWGRHWLDVAGYADSNGYFDADSDRPLAWKYRDYVVRAFNADQPFDRFVREQLAGDALAGYTPEGDITPAMTDPLTATHFLRNAPDGTGESDGNAGELRADRYAVLEGNVQIIGSALLGLTVQCARCHDHKFEPVTQEDYYGLQAILKPIYNHEKWRKPNERVLSVGRRAEREAKQRQVAGFERELKAMKDSLEGLTAPYHRLIQEEALEKLSEPLRDAVKAALDTKEKARTDSMKALLKTNEAVAQIKDEDLAKRFPQWAAAAATLREAMKKTEGERPAALPQLAVAIDVPPAPPPHHVLVRGNYGSPGREALPAMPAVLGGAKKSAEVTEPENRRAAFARWVTAPEHPTFARLAVNRVWQHHFGAGLVATPDNFGLTGARPTLPELLDWLATEFVRAGWSVKALHRLIVTSATYRQSSRRRDEAFASDPDNHLLWRFPLRRLDAEAIRDAMFSVAGEIDLSPGGPAVPAEKTEEGQFAVNENHPGARRRALYLQQRRTKPETFLDLFDGVKLNPNCALRTTSTMSLQSLALLNSGFSRARSRAFAQRLAREAGAAPDARLTLAFQLALARPPTPAERTAAAEFLETQRAIYAGQEAPDGKVWTDFCQMVMAGNAFLYVE